MYDTKMFVRSAATRNGLQDGNDASFTDAGIFVLDQTGVFRFCNDTLLSWLDIPQSQIVYESITTFLPDLILPVSADSVVMPFKRSGSTDAGRQRVTLHKPDGVQVAVTVTLDLMLLGSEKLLLGTLKYDPPKQLKKRSIEDLKFCMMLSKDAMAITDMNGRFEFVNDAFEAMTGYCLGEIVGRSWDDVLPESNQTPPLLNRPPSINFPRSEKRVSSRRKRDGSTFTLSLNMRFFMDAKDEPVHQVFDGRDISATVAAQENLEHLANYDALTQLPCRTRALDRLQQTLLGAQCNHKSFAIAIIDVDNFKHINDRFGHGVGDGVLQEVGARIKNSLSVNDTVGRLSGDEFLIVLPNTEKVADAEAVVDGIRAAFSTKFSISTLDISVGVSVGVAIYPAHAKDQTALLEYADAAMYRDKANGAASRQSRRRSRKVGRFFKKVAMSKSIDD